MPEHRLLVVNYDFPPAPSVGGTRWLAMRKYLRRMGYDVTVLTTAATGSLPDDEEEGVIRTTDLVASQGLRRLLRRPDLATSDGPPPPETNPPAVLTSVIVPDVYVASWAPFAIRAARRLVRERGIDCVITTSPKDSTHVVGLATLSVGAAWLADFRDGWIFQSTRPAFPTDLQKALDRRLEALVVRKADVVVAATPELATDFRSRLNVDASSVGNGWDPELEPEPTANGWDRPSAAQKAPRWRLVYTGTLSGAPGAAADYGPRILLAALEALARREPDAAARIELVIAGRLTSREAETLAEFDLPTVRHVGFLDRPEALRLQRSADVLVFMTGSKTSATGGKFFEYLGAGRPILHLGHPGATSRVLAGTGAGLTVAHDDVDALVEQLRRIADGQFGDGFAPRNLEQHSYPFLAEQMADVIEEAIRRGARRAC